MWMNTWTVNRDEFVWARSDDPKCSELESLGYVLVGESWGAHLQIAEPIHLSHYEVRIGKAKGAGIEIRALELEDIPHVIHLEMENKKDYPYTPATRHSLPTTDDLEEYIDSSGAVFGAFDAERLIGVLATKKYPETVEFEFASIAPDYRGKGIAGGLGSFAILDYLSKGYRSFATGGAAVNSSSKGSVESLGFVIDEFWRSYKPQN